MFKNSRGFRLAGELLVPAEARRSPVVVFAHGWGGDKSSAANRATARALLDARIAAFLFDFTGHGESEGTEVDCTPAQRLDDLRSALDVLQFFDEIDTARAGIVGAGSAADVVLRLAAQRPRLQALALRSPQLGSDGDTARLLTLPVQLLAGEFDAPARAASQRLVAALGGPTKLEVVGGRDEAGTRSEVASRIAGWFGHYLRAAS
jgi:pimeloyl-ACP methyl ester carboxylesterase